MIQGFTSLELSSLFPDASDSLLLFDTTASPPIPISIRIGDIDLDGFPDLIPIIVHKDGSRTPQILISHPCSGGGADAKGSGCKRGSFGRTFEALIKDVGPLGKIKDARGIALLDMDEDVRRCISIMKWHADPISVKRGHWILWCNAQELK